MLPVLSVISIVIIGKVTISKVVISIVVVIFTNLYRNIYHFYRNLPKTAVNCKIIYHSAVKIFFTNINKFRNKL